jgi:hypothetical protein
MNKGSHADIAAGVWKRITDLSARELYTVLFILGLKPVQRAGGEIVSLCPCCERPGATWTPKASVN